MLQVAAPPPPSSAQIRVDEAASVRTAGSGRWTSPRVSYPLGSLTYTASKSGRGWLSFEAGLGAVILSGADATRKAPLTWTLKLDRMIVFTARRVTGSCELRLADGGVGYRSLDCDGRTAPDGEPFEVRWRADEDALGGPTPNRRSNGR